MPWEKLELKLASCFEELDKAVETLQKFIPSLKLPEDVAYHVLLLASEALTNAIEHGNQWDKKKTATLLLIKTESRIELTVMDEGKGIHWSNRDPLSHENRMADHGRGQYFMKTMADEVHVDESEGKLRLVFYCEE